MFLDTFFISQKCSDLSAATLHCISTYMLKHFACYEKKSRKVLSMDAIDTSAPLISRLFPFTNTKNHTNSRIYGLILMTNWWSDSITECTDNDEFLVLLSPPHPLGNCSMHSCPAAPLVHDVLILTAFH